MHWQMQKVEPMASRPLKSPRFHRLLLLALLCVVSTVFLVPHLESTTESIVLQRHRPKDAADIIARCRQLAMPPGSSPKFQSRSRSDRFEEGTRPILIQNARIWTGKKNGTDVIHADILLDKGLIKSIGHLRGFAIQTYGKELDIVDAKGSWVTPGLVDLHSHLGLNSLPILSGASDTNSHHGIVQPWLRSLDGLNTHDDSYPLSIAGGVTTSLVLPGSGNAIGGQAFVIKLRETKEKSSSSMLLEPPYHINTSFPNPNLPFRWRHIKHACGENPSAFNDGTRMDTSWEFRQAYNIAKKIKDQQDEYCSLALAHDWDNLGEFPDEVLKWEALIDVLRGRVKVNVHCYEAVDLDAIVRLSNEYKFPIAAFHHASEAYLVPDLLKKAYGKPPAVALFATFARYKREAYRASEFAPRILAQHGLSVVMKSDHPGPIDARHLIYEAQQAYYYGLPENLAMASVTSGPSEAMGMGHRVGYIKEGYDADLVIWDSHPLALGATPRQVFIDGIRQIQSPVIVQKPDVFQQTPKVPNFDKEAEQAVIYEGLPPLEPKQSPLGSVVVFRNVSTVFLPKKGTIEGVQLAQGNGLGTVVTRNGSIICYDECTGLLSGQTPRATIIDLNGGSISPGFIAYGSPLGLENIKAEPSTNDGVVLDPLRRPLPKVLGGDTSMIQAVDGLQFGSRDALLAYRSGVTSAVSAPSYAGFYGGLSVAFSLGASHKLQKGAVIQRIAALHVSIRHFKSVSVSTQISALRRLLLGPHEGEAGIWFGKVIQGEIPLVVEAHNADIIATLIILKQEVEARSRREIHVTITGASEAHLLAKDLGEANIGVILSPSRSSPLVWEQRRILPGPPLSNATNLMELLRNNVVVGFGCRYAWEARNLPFDIAWAAIESGSKLSKEEALAIGSSNIRRLLGVDVDEDSMDLVATRGGDLLSSEGKVTAILSPRREATFLVETLQ